MHNAIPKTTFERMMNLLMKLALVALVETTVVVSEKKKRKREVKRRQYHDIDARVVV